MKKSAKKHPSVNNSGNKSEYTFQDCCELMKSESAMNVEDIRNDMKRIFARSLRDFFARIYKDGKCIFKNDYIAKRYVQSVLWYSKKAQVNKMHFLGFSAVAIALPTFSTMITAITGELSTLVAVFSAITAILTAILTLFKFQQNWIQFRATSEELQTELSLLISEKGKYSKKEIESQYKDVDLSIPDKMIEARENTFLIQIEKIMAKEKTQWESLHKPSQ
ncbi:MAG: DUF4231 domain-containing protein [Ruminococcus sp.]|nr:DUF4231 domain-containing protein [Ruminococcus sp.]